MSLQQKITYFAANNKIIDWSKRKKIERLNGLSWYNFFAFSITSLSKGIFSLRVAAVSWTLFFSLFPFLLFLFSVLPHVPLYSEIEDLRYNQFSPRILPERITSEVIDYVSQTARKQEERGDFNWLFILLAIYLSSNGISAIMSGFKNSYRGAFNKRTIWKQRLISILLTLFFVVLIISQLIITYYTNFMRNYMEESGSFAAADPIIYTINVGSATLFYFISMVILYHFGANSKRKFSTVFPGAILVTILFVVSLLGFQYYIKVFNKYDLLYGSVGLVMIMMLFIYINVILIMIGFELNSTIYYAKFKKNQEKITKRHEAFRNDIP